MKSMLRFALLALAVFTFASCVKTIEVPQPAGDPLAGSWYISDAAESYGNGWYPLSSGVDGTFTFYSNGTAQYDDGYSLLQGNWYRYTQSGGYYDEYGDYYTDVHTAFQVQAGNNAGGNIDLYFDNISFTGSNQFIGTYYNGKSVERYIFNRY